MADRAVESARRAPGRRRTAERSPRSLVRAVDIGARHVEPDLVVNEDSPRRGDL